MWHYVLYHFAHTSTIHFHYYYYIYYFIYYIQCRYSESGQLAVHLPCKSVYALQAPAQTPVIGFFSLFLVLLLVGMLVDFGWCCLLLLHFLSLFFLLFFDHSSSSFFFFCPLLSDFFHLLRVKPEESTRVRFITIEYHIVQILFPKHICPLRQANLFDISLFRGNDTFRLPPK